MEKRDHEHLAHALEQARIGRDEGGVRIGGALVADDGTTEFGGNSREARTP
jgi:tRNA(Arg) A34 adenosine deaminase TadA